MDEPVYVFVTRNGVYLVFDGRWGKATAFNDGPIGAGWGDWELLLSVSRGRDDMTAWEATDLAGVRVGDIILFRSSTMWAATSEVRAILTGADIVPMRRAEAAALRVPVLLLRADCAWLYDGDGDGDGAAWALGEEGSREISTEPDLTPDELYVGIVVTSDTGSP